MQRYRINYNWLIGVFVTSLVVAVVAFFVQRWQVERKAGIFLAKGEAALAEGRTGEAFDSYRKYVQLRPKEEESRIKMAKVGYEVMTSRDVTRENWSRAYAVLEQTVRTTNDSELRRDLAEVFISMRPQGAIEHLDVLLAKNPEDPELNAMMIRALFKAQDYKQFKTRAFKFVGYDQETKEFTLNSTASGEPEVYALLSNVLLQNDKNTELATRVIDQMVAANPESAQAHLQKSVFLSLAKENEEAAISLDKAYALDPKDATILSRKGMTALFDWSRSDDETDADAEKSKTEEEKAEEITEEKLALKTRAEEAKGYFALGLKEHPDNPLFYRLMAQAEQRLERPDAALKVLDQGILELEKRRSIDLVISKIDILFSQDDFPAIEREIKRLTQLNLPELLPTIDFQRARVQFRKQNWSEASLELKRVQPLLFNRPRVQVLAGTMLGVCYETQGIHDLALAAYKTVLQNHPNHVPAQRGRARMEKFLKPNKRGMELDRIINANVELPEAEQNWDRVNELVEEVIVQRKLGESQAKLLRAKVLMKRNRFDEAKVLIRQAAKEAPDDIDVHFAAILLVTTDPEKGSPVAMRLLDRLEGKWGVSLRSLAQRAELLCDIKSEDVSDQLRALANKTGDLTEAEKLRFDNVLGLKFEQLGKLEEAREFFEKSAAAEKNNLPIRMHLFDLALREQDDAAMQKAQAAILEFVKSKNHPNYVLTEVKRNIIRYSRRQIDREELTKSLGMLDKALVDRGKWHELHIAYGQVLLLLGRDIDLALQHFDEALDSGPAKSNAVRMQVKLLAERGLYAQARERMERLHKKYRGKLLGRTEAEVLVKTGDLEAGFAAAQELAKSQPNVAATQVWFSGIAQETGRLDLAATSLRRSLQLSPSVPANWLRLIGIYASQKKFVEAEEAMREAHLGTEAEFLPLLTGKYYEYMSRWQNAESIYLATYAGQLDNLAVSHRMAEFYLQWTKKDEANIGKASTFINRILRAANEGDVAADNPHVVWARQKAANILFAKQDYQHSLKAEALLRQSAVNSRMSNVESGLLADILISRNDPESLMQARKLLSELREQDRLSKKGALQLARLFSRTKQWKESKLLLLELLAKNASDPLIQATYIELLIDQGEYSSAESRIKRLRDLASTNTNLIELRVRLASEKGDQAQLNRLLTSLLPKVGGAMTPAQLKTVRGVAQLAERYGDNELAEKLYTILAKRVPDQAFQLARFLAYHGDCDQALLVMKRFYPDKPDEVIQLANRMITVRRDEVGDKYDELVDRLINAALREDPDSVSRQLVRAEAFEIQGENKKSIAAYDRLLQRDDLPTRVRAAAMNNLGFQLGLLNLRLDEAEQLINEAMKTFGPVADMLDTRAIVLIAQKKYQLAVEDMEQAVSVGQDPVKYFHLAKACILAGDGLAAQKAWKKAQELGFEKESLPLLEKTSFEQIRQQIESFQTESAKL